MKDVCPPYHYLRTKYIPDCYLVKPPTVAFSSLLSTSNESHILNIVRYVKYALDVRTELLHA